MLSICLLTSFSFSLSSLMLSAKASRQNAKTIANTTNHKTFLLFIPTPPDLDFQIFSHGKYAAQGPYSHSENRKYDRHVLDYSIDWNDVCCKQHVYLIGNGIVNIRVSKIDDCKRQNRSKQA